MPGERTREVTLDPGAGPSGQKPRARPEPARTRRGPSPARRGRSRELAATVPAKGSGLWCKVTKAPNLSGAEPTRPQIGSPSPGPRSSPGLTASDFGKLIVRPLQRRLRLRCRVTGGVLGCLYQGHLCFELGTRTSSAVEVSEVAPITQDLGTWYLTKSDLKLL